MKIIVLGSAAGGGFPQWNCRCPVCRLAWANDARVSARTQSGLAVSADGLRWVLFNASPDLRQQILATPALHPNDLNRSSPIDAVVLTNGELDHVAGLLALREQQPFKLLATSAIHAALDENPLFNALNREVVLRLVLAEGEFVDLSGVRFKPFRVPGKIPLYQEHGDVALAQETEHVLGLDIRSATQRFLYVPNCARITPALLARMDGADVLFFDGTTYHDDEMVRLGLSAKTAARMGHVAMEGSGGSLEQLAGLRIGRRIYIHLNNTNPVLVDGSTERTIVEKAGWELAFDGMELSL